MRRGRSRCASESRSASRTPACTPCALSPGASGRPVKRVCALRSSTRPNSISIVSASRLARPTTPRRRTARLAARLRARRATGLATALRGTGRPAMRARNAASSAGSSSALRPIVAEPRAIASCRLPGAEPENAALARARFRLRASSPNKRSARSGHASTSPGPTSSSVSPRSRASFGVVTHHAGLAHHVEVAQQRRGMHVIDHAAEPPRQRDRGARARDVGAEPRDHRQPACARAVRAASAMAASSATGLPSIQASPIGGFPPALARGVSGCSGVVLDVGEPLVLLGRAFERAAFLGRAASARRPRSSSPARNPCR